MDGDLAWLSVEALANAARQEVLGDAYAPMPHLVTLHERGDEEVLCAGLDRLDSDDRDERALGVWILRELGPIGADGRRPFGDQVVPRLLALLAQEAEPRMERLLLQALAFNGAREALPAFLARVAHPDDGVRETVAFQLPYVVGPAGAGEEVADAVLALAADADPDIRYYALHAVVEEGLDIGIERHEQLLSPLRDDPDEQVRYLARAGGGGQHPTGSDR